MSTRATLGFIHSFLYFSNYKGKFIWKATEGGVEGVERERGR